MRAPPCCKGRGTRASAAGCGKIFGPPDAERPADWADQSFSSARSAPCAKGLSTRAAGHPRCAVQLGRGQIRRCRCSLSCKTSHAVAAARGGLAACMASFFSSSGFPPFSWPAILSFYLYRIAPRAAPLARTRFLLARAPRRPTNERCDVRSFFASPRTDDRRTNDATCGPQAWLTGTLHEGGIRSVRSPPRRAPLLATPIAKPLQCDRP